MCALSPRVFGTAKGLLIFLAISPKDHLINGRLSKVTMPALVLVAGVPLLSVDALHFAVV